MPQNGWFISWKTLLKWMIWGVSTPIFGNTHVYMDPMESPPQDTPRASGEDVDDSRSHDARRSSHGRGPMVAVVLLTVTREPWKKGLPWLFRVFFGDEILPSYVGSYNEPFIRSPIDQPGFHGSCHDCGFWTTLLKYLFSFSYFYRCNQVGWIEWDNSMLNMMVPNSS